MTYTYKLSHRLALLRSVLALLILPALACSESDLGSLAPYDTMELAGDRIASISPKSVVIEADKPVKFKSSSESPDAVKWTATGGKITAEGTFSSPSVGEYLVVSSVSLSGGERTDTARVRVVRADGRGLTISPRSAELSVGQPAHFNVATFLEDGTPATMKVNFKVAGGEIDRDGNFVAGSVPGTYLLIAFSPGSGLADTASITVRASTRQVVRLLLAPATAAVAVGGSVKYVASAQYHDGSTEPVVASFTAGGGAISADGQYTAGNVGGQYKVTARTADSGLEAAAAVTVISEPVAAPTPLAPQEPAPGPTALPITVSDPSGYPNQPSGYTPFMTVGFDPAATSSAECNGWLKGPRGCWWRHGPQQSIKSDPSAPVGPGVFEMVFPAGLEPGWGQDRFGGWAPGNRQYREIYESAWFKIPSPDFETQLVGVKLWGFWGVGELNMATRQMVGLIAGNEQNTAIMSAWNIMFIQQDVVSRRMDQNLNRSKKLTAGTWHRYEIRMKLNDIGQNNGTLHVWLDGVPVMSFTDVMYRNSANPAGFFGRQWDPIWGGAGGTRKSRTDRLWVNNLYVSGIPM